MTDADTAGFPRKWRHVLGFSIRIDNKVELAYQTRRIAEQAWDHLTMSSRPEGFAQLLAHLGSDPDGCEVVAILDRHLWGRDAEED